MSVLNILQLIAIFICTFIAAITASICLLFSKKFALLVSKNIWAKTLCKIVGITIEKSNAHLLKKTTQPVIFCSNHQSNFDRFFDPVLIGRCLGSILVQVCINSIQQCIPNPLFFKMFKSG